MCVCVCVYVCLFIPPYTPIYVFYITEQVTKKTLQNEIKELKVVLFYMHVFYASFISLQYIQVASKNFTSNCLRHIILFNVLLASSYAFQLFCIFYTVCMF